MTATVSDRVRSWLTSPGALRVPEVGVMFWLIKGLSTAMGESTSDFLVHSMAPELAVLLGFAAFVAALAVQFRVARYAPWAYWTAVATVGIFGTMAADVVHVALGVPYVASSIFYASVLAAVFVAWRHAEGTLSIHSVNTPRRELFYWATVVATFAMGTALGDLTAYTLHLGYFPSAALFGGLIVVPAVGYRFLRWSPVLCFWFAYVLTRPLGASLADGLGKPKTASGLGLGAGPMVLIFAALIALLVCYLTVTGADVQAGAAAVESGNLAIRGDIPLA